MTDNTRKKEENIKSKAKAAGLKSTFITDNGVLLTSFGKGNEAVREKKVLRPDVVNINQEPMFDLTIEDDTVFSIHGRNGIRSLVADPAAAARQDLIGAKPLLEKKYFGKTFSDNIHIQLIHNILDIDKALALYINNVTYQINNIRRKDDSEDDDFIGYISTKCGYDEFTADHPDKNVRKNRKIFDQLYDTNARLFYFPKAFCETKFNKKGDKFPVLRDKSEVYCLLALLGDIRHYCTHSRGEDEGRIWRWDGDIQYKDVATMQRDGRVKSILDKEMARTLSSIDDGFVENNSKMNLGILAGILGIDECSEDFLELAKDFYRFVVLKSYKHCGFSIRKIRENILLIPLFAVIRGKRYDSVRSKLYQMLDFCIYRYYSDEQIANSCSVLRMAMTEQEKENVYKKEAALCAEALSPTVDALLKCMDDVRNSNYKKYSLDGTIKKAVGEAISPLQIRNVRFSYFSKMVNCFTYFLSGKEINDLLSTLVNKFDNIASFFDVMKKEGMECELIGPYAAIKTLCVPKDPDRIPVAAEMQLLASLVKMDKPSDAVKYILFREAATILGCTYTTEELEEHLTIRDPRKKNDGKTTLSEKQDKGTPDHNFRNFIINNVLDSPRFNYIVRYGHPGKLRALAENEAVVSFVLKDIPDDQIRRYYDSYGGDGHCEDPAEMRSVLTKAICTLSFNDFSDVKNGNNAEKDADKAGKQAIIRLYLTVLYLITKGLVYVNSRYTLAFHILERDCSLFGKYDGGNGFNVSCDLAREIIEKNRRAEQEKYSKLTKTKMRHRVQHYNKNRMWGNIMQDIANADDEWTRRRFRNTVAHMNAVRNAGDYVADCREVTSYFGLYHYIIQRDLLRQYENPGVDKKKKKPNEVTKNQTVLNYFEDIGEYRTYNMDFVKAYCAPFGYNLPRFKNLTVEGLFDRNKPGAGKKDSKKKNKKE